MKTTPPSGLWLVLAMTLLYVAVFGCRMNGAVVRALIGLLFCVPGIPRLGALGGVRLCLLLPLTAYGVCASFGRAMASKFFPGFHKTGTPFQCT